MKMLVLFSKSMNIARRKDSKEGTIKALLPSRFNDRKRVITEKEGRRTTALYLVPGFTMREKIRIRQRKTKILGKEKLFMEERKKIVTIITLRKLRNTLHNLLKGHVLSHNPYDNVIFLENSDLLQKF